MTASAPAPSSSLNIGKVIISSVLTVGAIAAIVWAIVWAAMNDARGDYAGIHYGDARTQAIQVMAIRYGGKLATQMRLGVPDVVNTHLKNSALIGDDQVRIFHLIGPRGIKYCVPIWSDGSLSAEANAIAKNCKF